MSAVGVGALAAALYLASRRSVTGLGQLLPVAGVAFGVGLSAFALSTSLLASLFFLTLVGAGWMIQSAASNTILQTLVREEMRGRVMSFYAVAILGTTPFGNLLGGVIAAQIGVPWTLFGSGLICLVAALVFAQVLPRLRAEAGPMYVDRGVSPRPVAG